jgi:hypothetical protein
VFQSLFFSLPPRRLKGGYIFYYKKKLVQLLTNPLAQYIPERHTDIDRRKTLFLGFWLWHRAQTALDISIEDRHTIYYYYYMVVKTAKLILEIWVDKETRADWLSLNQGKLNLLSRWGKEKEFGGGERLDLGAAKNKKRART